MKTIVLALCSAAFALLAGCAGTGSGSGSSSASSNTGPSGVTVFGTIDTSVSGYRSQSR